MPSAADLFEVGFQHFFEAIRSEQKIGPTADLVFFPTAFRSGNLRARFSGGEVDRRPFSPLPARGPRQRVIFLSTSPPHARLLAVSNRIHGVGRHYGYLSGAVHALFEQSSPSGRASDRRVWAFVGDGEMDEPESVAGLTLAAREDLDNLTFVVNCNLQRLDGPVRGNGSIVQELERLFAGARLECH